MKKLVLLAVLLLSFSILAVAQDIPKAEIFAGYSYVKLEIDATGNDKTNMNGWDANLAVNGNKYLAFVADFSGEYGDIVIGGQTQGNLKVFSALFGPKVNFRYGKFTPYIQGLFGATHASFVPENDVQAQPQNMFAMAFGGGVDISVNERISIRPAQVEYFTTKMGPDLLNHFRYTAGVIFKLGKR